MFGFTVVWQSYTAGGDALKLAFDTQASKLQLVVGWICG